MVAFLPCHPAWDVTHWSLCARSSHLALPHKNRLAYLSRYQLGQQSRQPHPPHLPAGLIDTHSFPCWMQLIAARQPTTTSFTLYGSVQEEPMARP